jgi:recombination associated protein RdgC
MAEQIDGQLLMKLAIETKSVPGQAIKRRTDELIKKFEEHTGVKPGKKITKELKETALQELLPAAFPKLKHVGVWINPEKGIMLIDSASTSVTDDVVNAIVNIFEEGVTVAHIQTEMSPRVAMTHWLGTGEAPYQFSVDRECELKSTDEMKSIVKYGRHPLDTDEIRAHITAGKVPTKLALTWRDRVSFVLDDCMRLKKIAFLDVVFESVLANIGVVNKGEAFDADAAIATGELRDLIPDLFEALGGLLVTEGGAA